MDDAVGKLVIACKGLEVWVGVAAVHFGIYDHYGKASRLRVSTLIDELRQCGRPNDEAARAEPLKHWRSGSDHWSCATPSYTVPACRRSTD